MVIGFGELRRGMTIELEGVPYKVEEYSQQKMQQRAPTYHVKLRNLMTGKLMERSFSGYGVKLNVAPVVNRPAQFLYEDAGLYYFMDTESFEQYPLSTDILGGAKGYVTEQTQAELVFYRDNPIAIEMPTTVDLAVKDTPPGVKGDTATGGTKPATMETGITVQVPLFINAGDKIKVDTRSGQYVERAAG